ncbi:MAG: hypothetical protein P8Y70_18730 [Candidatus Lokiarchaeota archaeon]
MIVNSSSRFKIFKLDSNSEKFILIKNLEKPIKDLLESNKILLLLDPRNSKVWIWKGSKAGVRLKFMAAQLAPNIRNQYAVDFEISTMDENNESDEFKEFLESIS